MKLILLKITIGFKKIGIWVLGHKKVSIVLFLLTIGFVALISKGVYWFLYHDNVSHVYYSPHSPLLPDRISVESYSVKASTIALPDNLIVPPEAVICVNGLTGVESLLLPGDTKYDKELCITSMEPDGGMVIYPIRRAISLEEISWLKYDIKSYAGVCKDTFVYQHFHDFIVNLCGEDSIKWDRFGRPYYTINEFVVENMCNHHDMTLAELSYIIDYIDKRHYGAIQRTPEEAAYIISCNEFDYELGLKLHSVVIKSTLWGCVAVAWICCGCLGLYLMGDHFVAIAAN